MPFTPINRTVLSDLVVHEFDPSVGYARRVITVQSEDPLTMGTVVFRAKSVNLNAPYAPIAAASALVATNEFAVVFGDRYGCKEEWTVGAADTVPNSVAFVGSGSPLILKDELIKETTGFDFGDANYLALKQLLENQGIVIERTLGTE